jgi:mycothiol synthase
VSRVRPVAPTPALHRTIQPVLDAASAVDGRPALSDHLLLDLESAAPGAIGVVAGDADRPVAYGQASPANDGYTAELVIDPQHRADPALADELLHTLLDQVARAQGGTIDWWLHRPTDELVAIAEAHGMRRQRALHRMEATLPVERHAEVITRPFDPDRDEEPWLAVNNRAFADHGEQGGWTIDTLRRREAESWFDPDGFRVHERDGRLAAFCWTKVHPADPEFDGEPAGEIYVIAVDPDFHGLGLGSQLTLAGLDHLSGEGLVHAILYVDAANATAIAMYERLGFTVASTSIAMRGDVGT